MSKNPQQTRGSETRSAPNGSLGQRLVYWLFRAFEALLKLVPLPVCFSLGRLAGRIAYFILPPYRRLALRNLSIAFEGEKDSAEIQQLAKAHFASLGANLFSSIKLTIMSEAQVLERLTIEGREEIEPFVEQGRGIIYLISHLGAWEILAQVGGIAPGIERGTLYQALSNPFLDAHVRGRRERSGTRTFDRKAGFGPPMELLRSGGGIGVLVDQHAGDLGTWCPFFGRLASTSNLAPLMAARTGAVMFPIGIETTGRGRWTMRIGGPLEAEKGAGVETATAKMNLLVEQTIRQSPADWFWVHNRWKTPKPKFLLQGHKRGVVLAPGVAEKDLKAFRILWRSPNPLGDACMSVPAVRAIKRGRPDAELTVLCPENLVGFWGRVKDVDHVIPRPKKDSNAAIGETLRKAGPFDVALLGPNSPRSAIEARKAGIPRIVGYPAKLRDKMVDQLLPARDPGAGPRPHHVTHYLGMAETVGANIEDESLYDPPAERAAPDPLLIGISAGAEYGAAKCYPIERFVAAVQKIAEAKPEIRFVLFGSPNEKAIGDELAGQLGTLAENRIGKTSLDGLMDELTGCMALISNDTGTMHLAAFLGVPTVAIFGSTEPAWTGPLGKGHKVLRHHVSCSPCFLRECPIDFRCMTEIAPMEVAGAALEILSETADTSDG